MKNTAIVIIALFMVITGCAEEGEGTGYKSFYNQYRDSSNIITFKVPGALASMFIDKKDVEIKQLAKKIDKVSFLIASDMPEQMIIDFNKNVSSDMYKPLMEIYEDGTKIEFFARVNDSIIEEILMKINETDELIILCMYGRFTPDDAKNIAKSINSDSALKMIN